MPKQNAVLSYVYIVSTLSNPDKISKSLNVRKMKHIHYHHDFFRRLLNFCEDDSMVYDSCDFCVINGLIIYILLLSVCGPHTISSGWECAQVNILSETTLFSKIYWWLSSIKVDLGTILHINQSNIKFHNYSDQLLYSDASCGWHLCMIFDAAKLWTYDLYYYMVLLVHTFIVQQLFHASHQEKMWTSSHK